MPSLALQAHQGTAQRGAPGWVCSGSSGAGTWGAQQSRAEPGATAHCSLAAIPQLQIPTSTPTRPRGARTVRAAAAWLMRHDRTQLVHGSFAGWGRIRACCKLPTQGLRQPAQTVRNQRPGRGLGEAAPANGTARHAAGGWHARAGAGSPFPTVSSQRMGCQPRLSDHEQHAQVINLAQHPADEAITSTIRQCQTGAQSPGSPRQTAGWEGAALPQQDVLPPPRQAGRLRTQGCSRALQ